MDPVGQPSLLAASSGQRIFIYIRGQYGINIYTSMSTPLSTPQPLSDPSRADWHVWYSLPTHTAPDSSNETHLNMQQCGPDVSSEQRRNVNPRLLQDLLSLVWIRLEQALKQYHSMKLQPHLKDITHCIVQLQAHDCHNVISWNSLDHMQYLHAVVNNNNKHPQFLIYRNMTQSLQGR